MSILPLIHCLVSSDPIMPFALYAGTEPGVNEDARLFLDLGLEYYVQLDAVNEL